MTTSTYIMGPPDSPLKFDVTDEEASIYNRAMVRIGEVLEQFYRERGRDWTPPLDAPVLQMHLSEDEQDIFDKINAGLQEYELDNDAYWYIDSIRETDRFLNKVGEVTEHLPKLDLDFLEKIAVPLPSGFSRALGIAAFAGIAMVFFNAYREGELL